MGKRAGRGFFPKVFLMVSKKTEEEELLCKAFGIGVRAEEAGLAGFMYTSGSEVAVVWFSLQKNKLRWYCKITGADT